MIDQALTFTILQEIDALVSGQRLAVDSDHLKRIQQESNILEYLVAMKSEGLIRGDLITSVASGKPRRMANIRLTYSGIRALRREY